MEQKHDNSDLDALDIPVMRPPEEEQPETASPSSDEDNHATVAATPPPDEPEPDERAEGSPEESAPQVIEQITDEELQFKWDEFMVALSSQARNSVWEGGFDSLSDLVATPREDLLSPRGPFSESMLAEIDDWLRPYGRSLKSAAERRSLRRPRRSPPRAAASNGVAPTVDPEVLRARNERMRRLRSTR